MNSIDDLFTLTKQESDIPDILAVPAEHENNIVNQARNVLGTNMRLNNPVSVDFLMKSIKAVEVKTECYSFCDNLLTATAMFNPQDEPLFQFTQVNFDNQDHIQNTTWGPVYGLTKPDRKNIKKAMKDKSWVPFSVDEKVNFVRGEFNGRFELDKQVFNYRGQRRMRNQHNTYASFQAQYGDSNIFFTYEVDLNPTETQIDSFHITCNIYVKGAPDTYVRIQVDNKDGKYIPSATITAGGSNFPVSETKLGPDGGLARYEDKSGPNESVDSANLMHDHPVLSHLINEKLDYAATIKSIVAKVSGLYLDTESYQQKHLDELANLDCLKFESI